MCGHILNIYIPFLNMISNNVVFNFNVLCSKMKHRFLRNTIYTNATIIES